ncbi:hypothetical protein P3T20_005117 [Paraburkholderia sp. GAS206C]
MPHDNMGDFGRFITSRQCSGRVNEFVEEVVSDLEQHRFTPVYDRTGECKEKPEAR